MARPVKYRFADLEVGGHLDEPLSPEKALDGSNLAVRRMRRAADQYSMNHGGAFKVRTLRKEGVARCIRVE